MGHGLEVSRSVQDSRMVGKYQFVQIWIHGKPLIMFVKVKVQVGVETSNLKVKTAVTALLKLKISIVGNTMEWLPFYPIRAKNLVFKMVLELSCQTNLKSIFIHTSYLSRTPRTMSVEKFCVMWRNFRCGDIF